MMSTLKAEFRKLLSVRSTFFITLVIVGLSCLFTYAGTAAHYDNVSPPPNADQSSSNAKTTVAADKAPRLDKNLPKDQLQTNILEATGAAVFITIVVVLLMAHEFRYNTINYTLTISNSRSRVLAAKVITSFCYALVAGLIALLVTVIVTHLAVNIKGLYLPPQIINWPYVSARLLGYIVAFALFGLAATVLVRNLTASIVALFALPTLDAIIGAFLTRSQIEPARFLPFSALSRVGMGGADSGITPTSMPSIAHAVAVFCVYLIPLWAIAWYLFLKRDAN